MPAALHFTALSLPNGGLLAQLYGQTVLWLLLCAVTGRLLLGKIRGGRDTLTPALLAPAAGFLWLGMLALIAVRCRVPLGDWLWPVATILAAAAGGSLVPFPKPAALKTAARRAPLRFRQWMSGLKKRPVFPLTVLLCLTASVTFPHWSVVFSGADDFHHATIIRIAMEEETLPPFSLDHSYLRASYHVAWHLAAAALGDFTGLNAPLAAAVAARVSIFVLPLALAGLVYALGRSRFAAGASLAISVFVCVCPLFFSLVGRWPFSVGIAGAVILFTLALVTSRDVRRGARVPLRAFALALLLSAATACVHAREGAWTFTFTGLSVAALALPAFPASKKAFVHWLKSTTFWAIALLAGAAIFVALNSSILAQYAHPALSTSESSVEAEGNRVSLFEVFAGGCGAGLPLLPPLLALGGLFLLKPGAARRETLVFLGAWWLTLLLLSEGNLLEPGGRVYRGENAKLQNFAWIAVTLALVADAARKRWWFSRQTTARQMADALAALAALCWLQPGKTNPEALRRDFFPVATVNDARCLKSAARALKNMEPGVVATPSAAGEGDIFLASGAGGWLPVFLAPGWAVNHSPFYHYGFVTEAERERNRAISALLLNAPEAEADHRTWAAALRAQGVRAVFLGEVEALRLFGKNTDETAAALKRLRHSPALRVRSKAGNAVLLEWSE